MAETLRDLEYWMHAAAQEASKSLCLRASCGAILVSKSGTALGSGYNAPPGDDLSRRACGTLAPSVLKPKTDRTCCVHAEWRALANALAARPDEITGSTMVFTRVGTTGRIEHSGRPYCTVCSRLTLDAGIGAWALWHPEGIRLYAADEYHRLSERYDAFSGALVPSSAADGTSPPFRGDL